MKRQKDQNLLKEESKETTGKSKKKINQTTESSKGKAKGKKNVKKKTSSSGSAEKAASIMKGKKNTNQRNTRAKKVSSSSSGSQSLHPTTVTLADFLPGLALPAVQPFTMIGELPFPDELLVTLICQYIPPLGLKMLLTVARVNKRFYFYASSESALLRIQSKQPICNICHHKTFVAKYCQNGLLMAVEIVFSKPFKSVMSVVCVNVQVVLMQRTMNVPNVKKCIVLNMVVVLLGDLVKRLVKPVEIDYVQTVQKRNTKSC